MFLIYTLILFFIVIFLFYSLYYAPKREIKRFIGIARSLGYSVYQEKFSFLSGSLLKSFESGKILHGDVLYSEKRIHPHFDMTVGNFVNRMFVTLIKPDLIKDFLKAENVSKYSKYQPMVIGIKNLFGMGVAFSEGNVWKSKRKIMSKLFNFELLKANISKIVNICNFSLDRFDKQNQKAHGEFEYDINKLCASITNVVMLQCFFGCDNMGLQIEGKEFGDFVTELLDKAASITINPITLVFGQFAFKAGITSQIRKLNASNRIFKEKLREILKERLEQIDQEKEEGNISDIIQAMVYEKRKNKEEFNYSDQDLLDEFSTFLIAGTDTTSRLITAMVYNITKNPQVERKLREEINRFIHNDDDITHQNMKNLLYLEMTINETLRFFGPGNGIFIRQADEDNFVCDLPVSKGTTFLIQPHGNHYNPKLYKDPEIFRPERWQKQCDNLHPYAFLAFSGGPRGCIGKQLAYIEAKVMMIKILKRYDHFKVPDKVTFSFKFVYEIDPFLMNFFRND